ncbi:MAG: MFS transporter [Gammaproteobacteria bacterium]
MSQFTLLLSSRFLPLFCTQFLGALNDNVYKNALVIFIAFTLADQVGIGGSMLVVIASGLFILPFFLFSATAGQIADKFEKAFLIRNIKIAEILIMCLAAVGFMLQDLYILMTVLFLMGMQSTFFGPLKYGILPQHLRVNELIGGNGMIQMGTYLAILVGTIIGGVLIAMKGAGIFFVSATVIILAVLGWKASQFIPRAEPADHSMRMDWNIIRQTWRIMLYSFEDRGIFITIIAISWFWFIGATFLSLVPGYTREILQGNELVATLLLFAFSVGIGSGSLLCETLSRARIEPGLVPMGAAGLTLFPLDLFIVGSPAAAVGGQIDPLHFFQSWDHIRILFDLVLIGFCGGLYIVPLYAMIQHRSSPDHRSRVIASANILNALFMVFSAVIIMALLYYSVRITDIFLVVAVMNLLIVGIIFLRHAEFIQSFNALFRYWWGRRNALE